MKRPGLALNKYHVKSFLNVGISRSLKIVYHLIVALVSCVILGFPSIHVSTSYTQASLSSIVMVVVMDTFKFLFLSISTLGSCTP